MAMWNNQRVYILLDSLLANLMNIDGKPPMNNCPTEAYPNVFGSSACRVVAHAASMLCGGAISSPKCRAFTKHPHAIGIECVYRYIPWYTQPNLGECLIWKQDGHLLKLFQQSKDLVQLRLSEGHSCGTHCHGVTMGQCQPWNQA